MQPDQGEERFFQSEQDRLVSLVRYNFYGLLHLFIIYLNLEMKYQYETLKVEQLNQGTIIRVTLYRPKKRNAMNLTLFEEIGNLFKKLNSHQTARVVIVEGDGPVFTSGLDTKQMGFIFSLADKEDPARNAVSIYGGVKSKFQDHILSIYQYRLPVLMGTHKLCIGLGVDFICSADIRYCTKDCIFAIRQIQLGLATDVGTLQFFPKITGNSSAFKELAYTGRDFDSQEALSIGFVSKVFQTKQQLLAGLLQTAKTIAQKSPIAINANKSVINQGEREILDNLQYVARINSAMLQTQDTFQAFNAYTQKRKTAFPKL